MDIVYVYRKWPKDWIELRYSLRSLVNMEYGKVFIVWQLPDRIQNVELLDAQDKSHSKYENVINKLKLICKDKRISDDFILMNDDIYAIKPVSSIPYYTKWTLKNHMQYILSKHWITNYYDIIQKVYELFPEWMSFNVHCPIVYNKKKLKKLLDKYWDEEISIRSLYWNMYNVEYKEFWNNDVNDCKVFANTEMEYNKEFLSSNDDAIRNKKFTTFIDWLFQEKSIYEQNFLSFMPKTMQFVWPKHYAVSLSRLVRFDADGNFFTDDQILIEELKRLEKVKEFDWKKEKIDSKEDWEVNGKDEEAQKKEDKEKMKALRQVYKEKAGTKAFGGRGMAQLEAEIAKLG